jgi:hypothetical protein
MPDQEGEIILSGSIEEVKSALTTMKAIQRMLGWYGANQPIVVAPREVAPKRKGKMKVTLHFFEDLANTDPNYQPTQGILGFRLMNKDYSRMNLDDLKALGNRIHNKFGDAGGFVWKKGKDLYSYTEWDKGYQLQVIAISLAEAKRVIEQVLDIQNHSPDWENLNKVIPEEPMSKYPTIPDKEVIFGVSARTQRQRPIADVRFRYATLYLPKFNRAITLVDRKGKIIDSLPSWLTTS